MIAGDVMKSEWESMTIEDLLALREQMQDVLSAKLKAKKVELERRLRVLNQQSSGVEAPKHRSPRAVC
jgi:ABC-type phosphate transport system auxiliary subunit